MILDDGEPVDRRAVLQRVRRAASPQLDGAYIPGVDMGTTIDDLAEIGTVAPDVACSTEDPSPWTALGTWAAIRSAVAPRRRRRRRSPASRVAVQGAGHVGANLAGLLAEDGADVLVADVDAARARRGRRRGRRPRDRRRRDPDHAVRRARAVRGRARDLAGDRRRAALPDRRRRRQRPARRRRDAADALARRGIVYVPDFLANAGGVIHIHALRAGWDEDQLRDAVLRIGERVDRALQTAAATRSRRSPPPRTSRANGSARATPHRREDRSARRAKRASRLEAERFVARQVHGVRRLQIGGHVLGVDPLRQSSISAPPVHGRRGRGGSPTSPGSSGARGDGARRTARTAPAAPAPGPEQVVEQELKAPPPAPASSPARRAAARPRRTRTPSVMRSHGWVTPHVAQNVWNASRSLRARRRVRERPVSPERVLVKCVGQACGDRGDILDGRGATDAHGREPTLGRRR